MAEPESLTCASCSTTILERDAGAAGWRYWSDGVGELLPFCDVCSAREFAADAPTSTMPEPPTWLLSCGHRVPLLEHERPDEPPRRPRMCPVCRRLRVVAVDDEC